jgi:hypothetical protein
MPEFARSGDRQAIKVPLESLDPILIRNPGFALHGRFVKQNIR